MAAPSAMARGGVSDGAGNRLRARTPNKPPTESTAALVSTPATNLTRICASPNGEPRAPRVPETASGSVSGGEQNVISGVAKNTCDLFLATNDETPIAVPKTNSTRKTLHTDVACSTQVTEWRRDKSIAAWLREREVKEQNRRLITIRAARKDLDWIVRRRKQQIQKYVVLGVLQIRHRSEC